MANEGFLGKHVLKGERAATDDHPVILHHLPLSEDALDAVIPVGTVMKRVNVTEKEGEGESATTKIVGAAWEPLLSTDTDAVPVAVVDNDCDPTGESAETSALCVVHGAVKVRLLKTGDGKSLTDIQIAVLAEHGVFAV